MPKTSLDLTGTWQFKEYPLSARRMRDLSSTGWLKSKVPSSIFTCLIEAGKINQTDIYTNPENFSSISEKSWVFRKIFDVPEEPLNSERIDLVFEGLDTIANVWLNEKLIARTDNMFIAHRFDVTKYIKPKNNELIVKFQSPIEYSKKLMDRYTKFSEQRIISPHRAYIRKAQYQFGWDWCPSLPGCGIWRPVHLEGIEKAAIEDIHIRTIHCNHQYADIRIAVKLRTLKKANFTCNISLSDRNVTLKHDLKLERHHDSASTVFRIDNPSLWWPTGYGDQHLYQINIKLLSSDEIIDQKQKLFGIRTVKLNCSPDKNGQKFQFEINDQNIYAKGANWIPASLFAGSLTKTDYEDLLKTAKQANINMLRVWGGGFYENDEFYELCDKLGIMLWQDFMFACAYYPDRKWFTDLVQTEAEQTVKRLRNHPSVVLWCGNNEIDWIYNSGSFGDGKKFYGRNIYHKLLPRLISELDPDRDYIPTTPFSKDKNHNHPDSGTVHNWNVWSKYKPARDYICQPKDVPRFVTEFGMQALPPMETIKEFCSPEQLHIGSEILEKHNYQLDGNSRLFRYIGDLFASPKNLEQFVYLSQITQARGIKTYVEHLRAHPFRNSGVLFWQFNDSCPALTWSAVDYFKRTKALLYYAKRFFANLLVVFVPEFERAKTNTLAQLKSINIVAINQTNQPLTATINCKLLDLTGTILDKVELPTAIGPFSTSQSVKLPYALTHPDNPRNSFLHVTMQKNEQRLAKNLYLYLPDKYIQWPNTQISTDLVKISEKKWKLKLKSNALAKDVQILLNNSAKLDDNFVDLIPNEENEILIEFEKLISEFKQPKIMSVQSALRTS